MEAVQEFDYQFRIHIFGLSAAGKTALVDQITDGVFLEHRTATIAVAFKLKSIFIDEKSVRLQLWEISGSERYMEFKDSRLSRANAIMMVYDITDKNSFDFAAQWVAEAKKNALPLTPILLLGNKADLAEKRVIDTDEGRELAKKYDAEFYETSAKTGAGLKELIWNLTNKLMKKEGEKQSEALKLIQEQTANSKCY